MNDLFCTPEQGKRLKELLPEIDNHFVWQRIRAWSEWIINYASVPDIEQERSPALTLQELRDVARSFKLKEIDRMVLSTLIDNATAPELADWVIARLEKKP